MKFLAYVLVLLSASSALAQAPYPMPQQPPQQHTICEQLEDRIEEISDALLKMTNESTKWHGAKNHWWNQLKFAVDQQKYFISTGQPTPPAVIEYIGECKANLKICDIELKIITDRQAYLTTLWGQAYADWVAHGCR